MSQDVKTRVCELFALTLGCAVPPGSSLRRDAEPKWDSVRHVELVFALEDEFGIRLTEDEIVEMNSIDAVVSVVERYRRAA